MRRPNRHATLRSSRSAGPAILVALALVGFGGCSGYTLRGKVIEGDISYAAVVSADDERLTGPGVAGVTVSMETDPGRLRREPVGSATSGPDGSFSIRVRRPGAGILIYDVGIEARRDGYQGVRHQFRLPPGSKRLLITLQPGRDTLQPQEESLMEQFERFRSPG
ncbi:MAG: carboxypeptidase regulatory-like domain-containing protein [Planctomycetota bacterium]|nr:MAG: carboxypeptidase regulatory-like domain-containing protein [Planctomycetota bacterium]